MPLRGGMRRERSRRRRGAHRRRHIPVPGRWRASGTSRRGRRTYQELLRAIAAGTKLFLVPFPFSLWHVIGYVAEALPSPPLTRNQVELMGQDNISKPDAPGFDALQISPQPIDIMLSG